MEKKWLFEIGDVVVHKAGLVDRPEIKEEDKPKAKNPGESWMRIDKTWHPIRYFVVERMEQTCHGGTQRFLLCRQINWDGAVVIQSGVNLLHLTEMEVVKLDSIGKR